MRRFQDDGDGAAFETLFARHKDELVSFLWRLAGNETIAEDVSQQAWLKLIETARRQQYRSVAGSSFRTWLFTLGRNEYVDRHLRSHAETRREPIERLDDDPVHGIEPDAMDSIDEDNRAQRLDAALRQLPWEQRDVIALWASEFSIEQMISLTGAPRDTVLSRKKYALARLRKLLAPAGEIAG